MEDILESMQILDASDKTVLTKSFSLIRVLEKNSYTMPFLIAGLIWEMSGVVVVEDGFLKVAAKCESGIRPIKLEEYTVETVGKLLKVYEEDLFSLPSFID